MRKQFDKWIFPLLSAWAVAIYIDVVQYLYVMGSVGLWVAVFLFLPIVLLEVCCTCYFSRLVPTDSPALPVPLRHPWFDRYALWGNLLLWAFLYYWWIVRWGGGPREMVATLKSPPVWKWYGPAFYYRLYGNIYLVLRAMGWATALAAALWLGVHYLLTIRWRRLRILTTVYLPAALSITLLLHLYYYGGLGYASSERVEAQEGVKKVFGAEQLREAVQASGRDAAGESPVRKFSYQSRGICFDPRENALFLSFGCEWCERIPSIVRFDLGTEDIRYLTDYGVREMTCREPAGSIYFPSLAPTSLREVSKHDLSPIRTIGTGTAPLPENWFPNSLVYDEKNQRIFVADITGASVTSFDITKNKIVGTLSLYDLGLSRWRGTVWSPVLSKSSGRLYLAASPDVNVVEIDPDRLSVLRTLDFPRTSIMESLLGIDGIVGMTLDEKDGVLYCQSAMANALFKVSLKSFAVERTYEGEIFAMRLKADPRRPVLYVLGYLSGTLIALDLESGERLWKIAVGGRPGGLDLYQDTLWVHSLAGAFRIDLPTIWRDKGYGDNRR